MGEESAVSKNLLLKREREIRRILSKAGADKNRLKLIEKTVKNVAWMEEKLDKIMGEIGEEAAVIEYDNGGGQSGVRENPQFKAYEGLWKAYITGLNTIVAAIPQTSAKESTASVKQTDVLSLVRARRKAESA